MSYAKTCVHDRTYKAFDHDDNRGPIIMPKGSWCFTCDGQNKGNGSWGPARNITNEELLVMEREFAGNMPKEERRPGDSLGTVTLASQWTVETDLAGRQRLPSHDPETCAVCRMQGSTPPKRPRWMFGDWTKFDPWIDPLKEGEPVPLAQPRSFRYEDVPTWASRNSYVTTGLDVAADRTEIEITLEDLDYQSVSRMFRGAEWRPIATVTLDSYEDAQAVSNHINRVLSDKAELIADWLVTDYKEQGQVNFNPFKTQVVNVISDRTEQVNINWPQPRYRSVFDMEPAQRRIVIDLPVGVTEAGIVLGADFKKFKAFVELQSVNEQLQKVKREIDTHERQAEREESAAAKGYEERSSLIIRRNTLLNSIS